MYGNTFFYMYDFKVEYKTNGGHTNIFTYFSVWQQ
jgi:hypothetical protein